MISRLLIANRAEIAVRVARGARELGIVPLGVHSEADAGAYHLRFMDDSVCIGSAPAAASYLNSAAILEAAKALRADALHPGYGFLSERAEFAQAVRNAGLKFVGPTPEAMAAMGSKIEAKRRVRRFNVPVVPGYDGDDQSPERLRSEAQRIGTPLLIKASAGGGGRGMRIVDDLTQFDEALEAAKREAKAAFGNDDVLLEKYLQRPRHIEFQVLADAHGTTLHFGERECSIQRRHQKIVEEAPSIALSPQLRAEMGAAAIRAAQSVNYVNAGTCEFMLDGAGSFYFLEMNTRLQVEHPVTEAVYGVDLVHWQLRIAGGERLPFSQDALQPRGWAIEGRIYAEDPANHMLPSIGKLSLWEPPEGPGVRVDCGVESGSEVSMHYDPMLAKLIVAGEDRGVALARLRAGLDQFAIAGVRTNLPLLRWIARDEAFARGDLSTSFLEERLDESIFTRERVAPNEAVVLAAAALLTSARRPWRLAGVGIPILLESGGKEHWIEANALSSPHAWQLRGDLAGALQATAEGNRVDARLDGSAIQGLAAVNSDSVTVIVQGDSYVFSFARPSSTRAASRAQVGTLDGRVTSPMPGKIAKIAVRTGKEVEPHDLLLVLEAMKMEHRIEASGSGKVQAIHVREGEIVGADSLLMELS